MSLSELSMTDVRIMTVKSYPSFDLGNNDHVTTNLKECSPSEPHMGFTVEASRKVNDGLALKQFHGREKDKMESHATLLLTLPYL
ncbi:unnamed protein product [Brassica oleracea var. botrytis]|uniref:Uncharacterized protein n=2 Tax=Brassica TaxID=3705 RepID=A0A3P6DYB3_BRAOL|nr:unnamed protein product [Brassica napus]VDD24139.1 unnamed protein product [Brassica oleracea]